jgi:CTP synthase (UTP-ammonia lyase)
MPFEVKAYVDDHIVTATAETAKEAFATAVDWQVVKKLPDVTISDGIKTSSIVEFASRLALLEIANTTEADAEAELRASK